MSKKKKNKKNKKNKDFKWYSEVYKVKSKEPDKKKKDKKDKKNFTYDKPVTKTQSESLSKKEIKDADSIVSTRPEVNKKLLDYQMKCNHAGNLITVEEYRNKSLTPSAYTPRLDVIESIFGKNALVCESCYQVVVDPAGIDPIKLKASIACLHALTTAILPRKKFKKKEIKKLNKLNNNLDKWHDTIAIYERLYEKGAFNSANSNNADVVVSSSDVNNTSAAKAFFL